MAVGAVVLGTRRPAHTTQTPPSGRAANHEVAPALVHNYRILRRPVRRDDALPTDYTRLGTLFGTRASRHGPQLGLVPSLARRAVIPGTQLEMWIVPGRHGYCIFIAGRARSGRPVTGGFGGSCGPVPQSGRSGILGLTTGGGASLAAGPPLQPLSPGEPSLASGLVPDNVDSVQLITAAGTSTKVTLADGFFATRLAAHDRLYAVTSGRRTLILP